MDRAGPEVFENAAGALDEREIRAELGDGYADLFFPLTKKLSGTLEGELIVRLVDTGEEEEPRLSEARLSLAQSAERAVHRLRLEGLPKDLERARTAPIVVDWSANVSGGLLRGKRSLYAALGAIEIQIRGPSEIAGAAPVRVIARDPESLAPLAGARVSARLIVDDTRAEPLFEADTDAHGELSREVSIPAGLDGGSLEVAVSHEGKSAWTRSPVRRARPERLHLSTDKTIYKPGQEIALRLLALSSADKTPIAEREVVFEALDGKGNKVFKRTARTDRHGVAAMRVPLDAKLNEGDWKLRAELSGAKAELTLPVHHYNLPKMKVEVRPERAFVLQGQTLAGTVRARYLFGRPVSGAQVAVTAKTPDGLLASASGTTDGDGGYAFALRLPDRVANADNGVPLTVSAEIVDTAGQRESGASALPLVAAPIVVRLIPAQARLRPGAEQRAFVTVSDPAGRPIAAAVEADVDGAKSQLRTGADGLAELVFTARENTNITVRATDDANRSHSRTITLGADAAALEVRTDRALYAAGERAEVEILAPGSATRVYLDVFHGGRAVESAVLAVENGRARHAFALTPAMRGALLFDAFALTGSGQSARGSQRALVDPEDRLEVHIESDRASFSPGDTARLSVRVADPNGPRVAAVGLSVVDEAVFALGGDPDDDLRTHFAIDGKILPAGTGVFGKTAADLLGAEPRAERDRWARLVFAAAPAVATSGLDYNSVREELPKVSSELVKKLKRDVTAMLKSIVPTVQSNNFRPTELKRFVLMHAQSRVDPFGRPYLVEMLGNEWDHRMVVRGAGPDERHGTADDASAEIWFGWVQWGDENAVDADGDFLGGGPRGAGGGAEAAGGAPPPNAPNQRADDGNKATADGGAAKVRADFRETIYTNPLLVTDSSGRASIEIPLADSITTWRATAHASTTDGRLGSRRHGFTTFQEFFIDFDVPTDLTAGDEITLPAIVYNYLSTEQTVNVTLDPATWMSILGADTQSVRLGPSEVRAVHFRIRAEKAGAHRLSLRGLAGGIGDALVREARVRPDGVPMDQSYSDKLNGTRTHTIHVPADAVENGTEVAVVLTPGFAAEAVSGTESLLQEPTGCFEQTTSTAWPNTLVTNYIELTGQMTPELREKSHALVTRGYQRLLTFESPTGGFNWWGDSDPGNRILSAIMLWHLKDMEGVIETDPAVKDRTLRWLVAQQAADGKWAAGDALHSGNEVLGDNEVRTTAFIAWALAHTGWAPDAVTRAAGWLSAHHGDATDLYSTALAANALAKIDANGAVTAQLFAALDRSKESAGDGRVKWPTAAPSWTGASGDVAAIETTGLVAYGLLNARAFPELATGAVRFIVSNKDAVGTWYNTQATMNALRALLAAASPSGSEAEGTFTVKVNGATLPAEAITRANGDVYRTIDLSGHVRPGDNTIELEMAGTGELSYRLSRRSFVPRTAAAPGPFAIDLGYDTSSPAVGAKLTVTANVRYTGRGQRDQVIVQIGRAPGFAPNTEELDAIVSAGLAERYEVRASDVTFYLMGLRGGEPRQLSFSMIPSYAFRGQAPASKVYAYYEPALVTESAPIDVDVR